MKKQRFALIPLLAGAMLVTALLAGACGDDDDDDNGGSTSATSNNSSVLSAIVFLDGAGLHDIDVSLNESKEVPATARTVMLKSAATLKLTHWPSEYASHAAALATTMEELAAELDKDPVDLAKAGELAAKVHDDEHELSHGIWEHLQSEAGIHHDEAEGDGHN